MSLLNRYTHWLHTRWPSGTVEKLPEVGSEGLTNVPGVRIVGDLSGIPLLKFSSDTGARAVHAILAEPDFSRSEENQDPTTVADIAILGAGVSGVSAAIEAAKAGLTYTLYEASQAFSTVANFPKAKPIYTYPTEMTPAGGIQYPEGTDVKESLLESMEEQRVSHGIEITPARIVRIERKSDLLTLHHGDGTTSQARRVIIAIGRSGNYRKLNVPGEDLDKVSNRLHDPKDYCSRKVMIVGGGDSAAEAAIALAECGSNVTLSYRKPELSRPKPENTARLEELAASGKVELALELGSQVQSITSDTVTIMDAAGDTRELPNDALFAMIGREAPLEFFRRSGIRIAGDRPPKFWISFALILLAFTFIYQIKKGGTWLPLNEFASKHDWWPFSMTGIWQGLGGAFADPTTLLGTMRYVIGDPGFYYSILYCVLMTVFGIRRIRRRRTPYVTRQTLTLVTVQLVPLFLLPYLVLPWMGFNGWFDAGAGASIADSLFPEVSYGSGREYWRAFGLILAWPLFLWNVFTEQPLWPWLIISMVQTFVIIPAIVIRWGKGAYCGWICSCGGMAETLGDTHRHKMPHGPLWNRMNMIGQVFLAFALLILLFRIGAWIWPGSVFKTLFAFGLKGSAQTAMPWGYAWFVDLLFAGIIGFGCYFHFSGRVWCRFACPLAALMHIYARFGKFRIFAEKSKCISCNVCTSVCHQGIDIMSFANKGLPMEDPQCVRCSACVQQCPTGVLSFGRTSKVAGEIILDKVPASPVQMQEQSKQ